MDSSHLDKADSAKDIPERKLENPESSTSGQHGQADSAKDIPERKLENPESSTSGQHGQADSAKDMPERESENPESSTSGQHGQADSAKDMPERESENPKSSTSNQHGQADSAKDLPERESENPKSSTSGQHGEAYSAKDVVKQYLENPESSSHVQHRGGKIYISQLANNGTRKQIWRPPGKPAYFKSRLVKDKSKLDKPWMTQNRNAREKLQAIFPLMGIWIGFGLCGFLIWHGYHSVSRNLYCSVLSDDFKHFNESVWRREVEVGGFGVGSFEETTNSDRNSYISDDRLVLNPTLQDEHLINNDNVVDLRNAGCTGRDWKDCVAVTNTTNGTIVNPVKSARINTKDGANIKYGRVEVTARLPSGDWLWPSIFLLPSNKTYGEWPQSGQINIMQSRGNNYTYEQGGNNIIASCLHFGPNREMDGWWRNNVKSKAYRETFSDRFHKFGVEWTEKYIFTYIDTRLLQVAYQNFDKPFWKYGEFPTADPNGTRYVNPWEYGSYATPFDQDFYLVIKLGVGATNGWFDDNKSGKPWLDREQSAKMRFWQARDQWYPTWKERGRMEIKSVRMWQQAGYGGCKIEDAQRLAV